MHTLAFTQNFDCQKKMKYFEVKVKEEDGKALAVDKAKLKSEAHTQVKRVLDVCPTHTDYKELHTRYTLSYIKTCTTELLQL
jgi:hypothetical protein